MKKSPSLKKITRTIVGILTTNVQFSKRMGSVKSLRRSESRRVESLAERVGMVGLGVSLIN